ncbi:MAG: sensor histidine kinase [Alphaproteobacteria bacterium]|nr:sensor histidine kinase [Alphaproteobacteria bacterium]MBL6937422.1 sensor histidine kinase [Alphaproteobacteria bacterium]MBL7096016.1 sensor histidine kinase [Alphaproteobacteria bacterium]
MFRLRKTPQRDSLLTRYADTLGEMMMRRRTEVATRAAKAEADLASRSKSAFLATMSHELRTPLNSIIGFSDVIAGNRSQPESAEYATHIAKSGRRMLAVVNDILDISKIEAGSFQLNVSPADIGDIVDAAVEAVRDEIDARHQILDVRVPPGLPVLTVDHKRVRQIVVNLLSNASKFTSERGRIVLVARRLPTDGVTIAIADTGIGMTPEEIEIALTPFGQVQGHLSRTQEGAGLGLPLASALAHKHGGDIKIESQPSQGTTVFLNLPPDDPSAPR